MTKRVRAGSKYRFEPVGMDIWDSRALVEPGTLVKVVNLYGCPRANTMGHCHIQTLGGEFAGLVLCNSLRPA
jgi:hypothetical protein